MYQGSIRELHQQLVNKERSAVEIAQEATLEQIETVEPKVQAFLSVTADHALATAKQVDDKIAAGESLDAMEGFPLVSKIICVPRALKLLVLRKSWLTLFLLTNLPLPRN